jgi:hypothetical protein
MKRKALFLVAAIAEFARFIALMLLASSLGAIGGEGGAPRLLRYASAPQLLFAAGFFFLWLDYARYGSYRPLLGIGKLVALAALLPLAIEAYFAMVEPMASLGEPRSALLLTLFIAAVDIGSLAALGLGGEARAAGAVAGEAAGAIPAPEARAESVELAMPAADATPPGKAEV